MSSSCTSIPWSTQLQTCVVLQRELGRTHGVNVSGPDNAVIDIMRKHEPQCHDALQLLWSKIHFDGKAREDRWAPIETLLVTNGDGNEEDEDDGDDLVERALHETLMNATQTCTEDNACVLAHYLRKNPTHRPWLRLLLGRSNDWIQASQVLGPDVPHFAFVHGLSTILAQRRSKDTSSR